MPARLEKGRFRCPFGLFSPDQNEGCWENGREWSAFRRLKEHIHRSHFRPVFCANNCGYRGSQGDVNNHRKSTRGRCIPHPSGQVFEVEYDTRIADRELHKHETKKWDQAVKILRDWSEKVQGIVFLERDEAERKWEVNKLKGKLAPRRRRTTGLRIRQTAQPRGRPRKPAALKPSKPRGRPPKWSLSTTPTLKKTGSGTRKLPAFGTFKPSRTMGNKLESKSEYKNLEGMKLVKIIKHSKWEDSESESEYEWVPATLPRKRGRQNSAIHPIPRNNDDGDDSESMVPTEWDGETDSDNEDGEGFIDPALRSMPGRTAAESPYRTDRECYTPPGPNEREWTPSLTQSKVGNYPGFTQEWVNNAGCQGLGGIMVGSKHPRSCDPNGPESSIMFGKCAHLIYEPCIIPIRHPPQLTCWDAGLPASALPFHPAKPSPPSPPSSSSSSSSSFSSSSLSPPNLSSPTFPPRYRIQARLTDSRYAPRCTTDLRRWDPIFHLDCESDTPVNPEDERVANAHKLFEDYEEPEDFEVERLAYAFDLCHNTKNSWFSRTYGNHFPKRRT